MADNTNSEKMQEEKINDATNKKDDDDGEVIPTGCEDWSLNEDETKKRFWWHKAYGISIWEANCKVAGPLEKINDEAVWKAFIKYQSSAVYKLCAFCKGPEGNDDFKICCYCGLTLHQKTCSKVATAEQMAWKSANKGFESLLCCCFSCDDEKADVPPIVKHEDGARRAAIRALSQGDELPVQLRQQLNRIKSKTEKSPPKSEEEAAAALKQVQVAVAGHFQPQDSATAVRRDRIASKAGGFGVVAERDIEPYTIIGVYPGYEDPLSGEQLKQGRPSPKYSLVDLNCADYWNRVFTEFDMCFTPFINEPTPAEFSNCAWIQETCRPEGRLSVMSTRKINKGEELLIGYGPLYPRDYPYNYDAYAYHLVEGYTDCFALWHWKTNNEKDADFVCYVGYDAETDVYSYWETEEEQKARKAREKEESK